MSLRRRILTAIILCLLLPLLIIGIVMMLVLNMQTQMISATYDVDANMIELIQNSPSMFMGMAEEEHRQFLSVLRNNPERLTDMKWLSEQNKRLDDKFSFLCLRIDDRIVYIGNESFFKMIESELPAYVGPDSKTKNSIFLEESSHAIIRQIDFQTGSGENASLFIFTDVKHLLPQMRKSLVELLIALLAGLVLTTVIVVTWLYRSIVQPLAVLGVAANRISEGNLDCAIVPNKNDEIGELQSDFETMRIHLKTMSDRQLAYQQESREMISNISHDLKTPLTAIKGYAEGLMDGVADTLEKQERYLKTIYSKACDMQQMVEELAFFSKIEQQAVTYNFREVPLHRYLLDCIEEQSLDLETKGITLTYEEQLSDGVKLIFDPEHIKRVIMNIVGNSVKYMDKPDGHIRMRVEEETDRVWIGISDNGCGIPESDVPYIFDRFYRSDSSRGTKKGGSGLGLSIVKSIVSDHNGTVEALSREGEGTTIRFSLPKPVSESVTKEPEKTNGGKRWKKNKQS